MLNDHRDASHLSPEQTNLATLHDILSSTILTHIAHASSPVASKHARKKGLASHRNSNEIVMSHEDSYPSMATKDAEDLAEFTEYLASELFMCLPAHLQQLPPQTGSLNDDDANNEAAQKTRARYTSPLPNTTLAALLKPIPSELSTGIQTCLPSSSPSSQSTLILKQVLETYCETIAPPPSTRSSTASAPDKSLLKPAPRPDTGCELCARPWIPLTQHHLIPRSAAPKAVKRGWHTPEACQTSIAWLCRACHSFVHGLAGNDDLAREWYSVELLEGREDVQRWVAWVGRVRWKAR